MAPHSHPRRALLFTVASACSTVYASQAWPEILPRNNGIDFTSAPPNLTTLANNSLFTHWRPKAHYIAPNSWMNDPMTLWYKEDGLGGGKFKASYQAYPNHVQWGNISQASAASDDLIHWKDVPSWKDDRLTLAPSQPNDRLGVFDGTVIPKGYKGFPTLIYTGVKYLPTGWKINYTPGTETQNLAWTEDGGVTWKKLDSNPIMGGPPAGMNVTAWRDPWLFQSPALERLAASNPGTPIPLTTFNGTAPNVTANAVPTNATIKDPWFATVSGGEKGVGPHLLLYRQASEDFTQWVYLGQIFQHQGNHSWSEWSGNWGWNFEVSTVVRLGTEGDQPGEGGRDFICMGTEGGRPGGWSDHWSLWVKGNYSNGAQLTPEYAGVVDWGETYAFMSFPVPRKKGSKDIEKQPTRQILFGWAYEDDNGYGLLAKGWQGMFTLPRDMFVKRFTVQDPRAEERGSWGIVSRANSSITLETLGTRPADEVEALTKESKTKWSEKSWTHKGGAGNTTWKGFQKQPTSRHYVLSAKLTFDSAGNNTEAGFTIYKSPDGSEQTHIFYDLAAETIRVDRSKSSLVSGFNLKPDSGKLRLWNVPNKANGTKLESLDLKVFVDNSVVEIYANDVFALTTRVYPWRNDSVGLGYYTAGSGNVKFSSVKVWEGLTNAWPDRPADTSNKLVWDGPDVPWAGY